MIESLKSSLLDIRKQRDAELEKFSSQSGIDLARCEARRAILTLELPCKTDTLSIHHARALAYQKIEGDKSALLGIDPTQEIVVSEEGLHIRKKRRHNSKNLIKIDDFLESWIVCDVIEEAHIKRMFVFGMVKNIFSKINFYNEDLRLENLPYILTLETMSHEIKCSDIEEDVKNVYMAQAQSLWNHISYLLPISPVLRGRRARLSLNDAAKLFDYLEIRALKSSTIQKYNDLLLCRALFYVSLPEKKFFNLEPPAEEELRVKSQRDSFKIPGTFVRLWKAFSRPNSLFERSFDDRQLHKKIQRLGKYAGLTIESLTPSILRLTGEAAYSDYLSLTDDVIALLPIRG